MLSTLLFLIFNYVFGNKESLSFGLLFYKKYSHPARSKYAQKVRR